MFGNIAIFTIEYFIMKFTVFRHTRFTFVQYIISKMYLSSTSLQDVINNMQDKYFNYEIDRDYLDKLILSYENNYASLNEKLNDLFERQVTFDKSVIAFALAALSEMEINDQYKLITSEYVKISIVCECNTELLNGLLNKHLKSLAHIINPE